MNLPIITTIDNAQYRVEGKNIKHYQNTNVAEFFWYTTIINKEKPSNYVYTENWKYLMNENKCISIKILEFITMVKF